MKEDINLRGVKNWSRKRLELLGVNYRWSIVSSFNKNEK